MEFCPTGDLSRCLWQNKNNRYNERTIKMISSQLLMGLQALHKNGIIHCNLKPSNILIDEYGNMRICDFKKSLKTATMNMNEIKKNKTAMTPCYTAPELFMEDGLYSFKTDFWALGCIMFELAVGQVPFIDESIDKLISKIINEEVNYNRKELSNYSDEFIEVVKKLLEKDPNKRSTWGEIEKFSFWEGFLNDGTSIQSKNSTLKTNSSGNKGIDALRLSKIAMKNMTEKKEDYSNPDKVFDNPDQEFDFEDKDNDDDKDIASNSGNYNRGSMAKNTLGVSVLKISKLIKKDKRTYNDINAELIQSSDDDMPKLETFFIHQTDRIIKPIIGNKQIEENPITTYSKNKLPFTPWKIDVLKEMMNSPKDIKAVENYLYNIYTVLDSYAAKSDYDNMLNLLKYFETIVFDRELANNLINTSFISQFISFLKMINNDQVKVRCCCIIGYLIRYATIIEEPLDKYDFCDNICHILTNNTNQEVIKKATATLGEYLFYVATQEETPESNDWKINDQYLNTLLFLLENKRNDIVKFYTIKAIENICILTEVSKTYFAKNEAFLIKAIDVYKMTKNIDLKQSVISLISHLIRHNPSFIKTFLDKVPMLTDTKLFTGENQSIQQSLINCLLYSVVGDSTNLRHIIPKSDSFISQIITMIDKCNSVIKIKSILLLGFVLANNINLISQFGEAAFTKMLRLRKEKNKELHVSVKFFEKIFISNCPFFCKNFITLLSKPNKDDEILNYTKCFSIIGNYHKISTALFTNDFVSNVISYINSNSKKKNEDLTLGMFEILLKFSENPISVEANIDYILKNLLVSIINLTKIADDDNKLIVITIVANILTIILDDDRLYSSTTLTEGKTKGIMTLIKSIIPLLGGILKQKEMTDAVLSLLALIIERDASYVSVYHKEGIIDYIFTIMTNAHFALNLNIIKILITLTESNEIGFNEIIKMKLIDKINFLIQTDSDSNSIYIEYSIELFYDLLYKLNEYKKNNFIKKLDKDTYKKKFANLIENVATNFKLCIRLIGDDSNVGTQERACMCIVFLLQLFPEYYIESLKIYLKFTSEDIPNLLKGLELSCARIHKKMIKIFIWIIQFQNDAESLLKPYVSYITTYLENICNTSADPDVIQHAQKFMNEDLKKLKKK